MEMMGQSVAGVIFARIVENYSFCGLFSYFFASATLEMVVL